MNNFFERVVYINLDRREDRRQHMESQLSREGITAERFSAIDSDKITEKFKVKPKMAGCNLSHMEVLLQSTWTNSGHVLVLEDDAVFATGIKQKFNEALPYLPDDWQMLYLGASHPEHAKKPEQVNKYWWRLYHGLTTHAYAVNKNALSTVLAKINMDDPIDCHYTELQKELNCYIINPPLAWQMAGHSDIENRHMSYPWIKEKLL